MTKADELARALGMSQEQIDASNAQRKILESMEPATRADIIRAKYDLIYWIVGAFIVGNIVQIAFTWLHH